MAGMFQYILFGYSLNIFWKRNLASGRLKEAGTSNWNLLNNDATDITGLEALPGGVRGDYTAFYDLRNIGYWRSSTRYDFQKLYVFHIYSGLANIV